MTRPTGPEHHSPARWQLDSVIPFTATAAMPMVPFASRSLTACAPQFTESVELAANFLELVPAVHCGNPAFVAIDPVARQVPPCALELHAFRLPFLNASTVPLSVFFCSGVNSVFASMTFLNSANTSATPYNCSPAATRRSPSSRIRFMYSDPALIACCACQLSISARISWTAGRNDVPFLQVRKAYSMAAGDCPSNSRRNSRFRCSSSSAFAFTAVRYISRSNVRCEGIE